MLKWKLAFGFSNINWMKGLMVKIQWLVVQIDGSYRGFILVMHISIVFEAFWLGDLSCQLDKSLEMKLKNLKTAWLFLVGEGEKCIRLDKLGKISSVI